MGTEEGQALANELNVMFKETSAKVGVNIKQLFKDLAATLPGVDSSNTAAADGGATAGEGAAGQEQRGFTLGGSSGAAA